MNTNQYKPTHLWISLCITMTLLSGCKSLITEKDPAWVENPHTTYPDAKYLVAIGEGDTRHAAENAASANLSRTFEAHIESDERLLDQSRETSQSFERTTDFTSSINILSSQTLFNIKHAEAWKDKLGRYHAVAYLERRSTAAIYRDKIDEQTSRVNFLLASAQNTNNLLKKYAIFRAASRHATEAKHLTKQLKVIQPRSVLTPSYSENKLHEMLANTAKQIRVQISVKGDDAHRITSTLEELITRYGFVVGTPSLLNITGSISVNDTEQHTADLVFVRYALALQIRDIQGTILVSVNEKGREGHVSLNEARARSFRTLENIIRPNGAQRLDAYFDSLIDPAL